jgi:hypothetical protein
MRSYSTPGPVRIFKASAFTVALIGASVGGTGVAVENVRVASASETGTVGVVILGWVGSTFSGVAAGPQAKMETMRTTRTKRKWRRMLHLLI